MRVHQAPVIGPNPTPTHKIDRRLILDPKDFWPDALKCPDWPALGPNEVHPGRIGKLGAEQRLETIGLHLNRGDGELRVPTQDERDDVFARTFRRVPNNNPRWQRIGIRNLSPLGMMVESHAELMVEACHIRGYLRKLEAAEKRAVEQAEEHRKAEARRTLADYRAQATAEIAEIKSLAEAAARHCQRIEDERAFARSQMLRDHVETLHSAAVRAAHTLGLGVPDAPFSD